MTTLWLISHFVLWTAVLGLGFLLFGTLGTLAHLNWRLDELQATRPVRLGRSGLRPGTKAPDFTLQSADGNPVSLRDFAGEKLLLVFVQAGCGPCRAVVPELNRLHRAGGIHVLAVHNTAPEEARRWAAEIRAEFPVAAQQRYELSKKYEIFATPYAFLIDGRGAVAAAGIINNRQHIGFVLDQAKNNAAVHQSVDQRGLGTNGNESRIPRTDTVTAEAG